mgnify:CR=1 FL=1
MSHNITNIAHNHRTNIPLFFFIQKPTADLSNTDVTTQLAWQRSCEKDGDPWLAIVIDPLRSLAKSTPVMESFRVYPPEYAAPANETPDGKMVSDETTRVQVHKFN